MKVAAVIGTRPNFIKASVVVPELERKHEVCVIDTGQHYDGEMSSVFVKELDLPVPHINLRVRNNSSLSQTWMILKKLQRVFLKEKPDLVMVFGDTNSTLAGALAAVKMFIPVAHVEAGYRSGDWTMPEEINRILTDHCSLQLFSPTKDAVENLINEGIMEERIFFVGSVTANAALKYIDKAEKRSNVLEKLCLNDHYCVLTLHRPENVDDKNVLQRILDIVGEIKEFEFVFPIHPRTLKRIKENNLRLPENLIKCNPLGYLDFLKLLKNSFAVLTDSGGIQEECMVLGIPCLTLRKNTERTITLKHRGNLLVGTDRGLVLGAMKQIMEGELGEVMRKTVKPKYWDDKVGHRIMKCLSRMSYEENDMVLSQENTLIFNLFLRQIAT